MIIQTAEQLADVRFDERGLVPVVAQHALTGSVLMLAYANQEALTRSLELRMMHYFSRSRGSLWQKGETSGHVQHLVDLHFDCDGDAVLARVLPAGPSCHTGAQTCFGAEPLLAELAQVIEARQREAGPSYTAKLFADENLRLKKLGEEAVELALACARREPASVRTEAADLVYHALVACSAAGVRLEEILAELLARRTARANEEAEDEQQQERAENGQAQ